MKFLPSNQKGDTIVEVLIAIAIVSLVLGGAFVSTRRSSTAVRTAQERGEALKFAEKQVELLKVAGATGNPPLAEATPPFCMTATATPASADPLCAQSFYHASIISMANTYTVTVQWDGLNGATNNLELDYTTK